jgi:predicted amidohydrolase
VTAPKLKLLACQVRIPRTCTAHERDLHVSRTAREIEQQLLKNPVDLVVLPELSSIDYSRETFDHLAEITEGLDGPSFSTWSVLARRYKVTIVFGIARRDSRGYHISQLAVGPDGKLIGHFDKIHIAQYGASMEKEYFQRGNGLFVFELNGVRIAPIICYDIRIPELTRVLCVQHEVDLILHCGAYSRDRTFYSWHPFIIARALENQVFILSLNRAGENFGLSLFSPPWVDELHPEQRFGEDEEYRQFEIDLAETAEVRQRIPFLSDRLPDYEDLSLVK